MKITLKIPKWLLIVFAIALLLLVIYGIDKYIKNQKVDCCPTKKKLPKEASHHAAISNSGESANPKVFVF